MKKRLFLAILLSEEIKEELIGVQGKYKKLNVWWVPSKNLHFTIIFIGWTEEGKIGLIKEVLKKSTDNISQFFLKIEKIVIGPDKKIPRMIWAVGACVPELNNLKKIIASEFKKHNIQFEDRHSLKLHITLARVRNRKLGEKRIDENLDLIFPVEEIFLMESELKSGGVEYKKIESIKLKK